MIGTAPRYLGMEDGCNELTCLEGLAEICLILPAALGPVTDILSNSK
jgi:hypothetical protein